MAELSALPSLPDFTGVPEPERAALVQAWHAAAAASPTPQADPARQAATWRRIEATFSCPDLAETPEADRVALAQLWALTAQAQPVAPSPVPDRMAATWARIHSSLSAPDLAEVAPEERDGVLQLWNAARFAHPSAPPVSLARKAATWTEVLATVRAPEQATPAEVPAEAQIALARRLDRPARARARGLRRLMPFVLPAMLLLLSAGGVWGFLPTEQTAPAGGTRTVRLADGSTAVLSGGSTLRNTRWNPRAVRLQGVAFFDVAHDAAHPFTVEAPGASVRVLGTAFEVKATGLPGTTSEVTVARGRVAVASPEIPHEVLVDAGERLRLDAGAASIARPYPGPVAAWRTGAFSLTDARLADVFALAATRFDTHIVVPAVIGERRWTVDLVRPTGVEEILTAVCEPLGLRFRQVDGGYEVFAP